MESIGCPVTQASPSNADVQVPNSSGGSGWEVTDMTRLQRFLCFGSEAGMYSVKEQHLSVENAQVLIRLLEEGRGCEVVQEIKKFSQEGRAARVNPAIFALAVCSQHSDVKTKQAAFKAVKEVCHAPTHLFTFVQFKKDLKEVMRCGMWGRALRKAVADWYNEKDAMSLALAVTKYKQRIGWSHQDLLRLSHMKPANEGITVIIKYITKGWKEVQAAYGGKENLDEITKVLQYLEAVEKVKHSEDELEIIHLIEEHRLEREQLLTNHLKSKEVWKALLKEMPITGLLRNLGKMTANKVLQPGSADVAAVCERLQNESALKKAKLHPFHILVTLQTYKRGHGNRGKLKWEPDDDIVQALDKAFYKCFMNVESTGKRFVVGVDVSAPTNTTVLGSSISAATTAAAVTMVVTRTEVDSQVLVFSEGAVSPCAITTDMSLSKVTEELVKLPALNTDCALPVLWATENERAADIFIVFTNNDTWFGKVHPAEALRMHRHKMGVHSKLIVCGLAANCLGVADPDDRGMLEICGFDSGALDVIGNFARDLI
ncbi:60 kDa SS-A/Ro ribonucleoprotein [Megalops cyprinoides]|uniref:60 kDa SS-A/Ro ribonucleoprotein n=1 Tax=Megalops cyprinoides TaxID=118141 RepID=UPI001864CB20|nr:60 kDa SS-A/Ro ribonucleoprotein [Megalops cyprinoides]XP_036410267.1 60 kDa SS-A/Ro ribonucleoprotein [Megalops cyprinoides]